MASTVGFHKMYISITAIVNFTYIYFILLNYSIIYLYVFSLFFKTKVAYFRHDFLFYIIYKDSELRSE